MEKNEGRKEGMSELPVKCFIAHGFMVSLLGPLLPDWLAPSLLVSE